MASLRSLLSAVPMWTSPLVKGGPSWRTKAGLPVGDPDGFAFGQAGPHREVGDGQVEGILELFGHV